jgi:cystathionine beta-lyase/cystathionine gamma-synthase
MFGGKGCGAMISFEIDGAGKEQAFRFMEALELCLPATTLGDVYTLVLHPATASHRSLTAEERARVGITDGLVRLSVGIEAVEDIQADLDQALRKC